MRKLIVLVLSLIAAPMAQAGLIQITATAVDLDAIEATDFTIIYDDTSGDSLFQIEELVSFSGVRFDSVSTSLYQIGDDLLIAANVPGISTTPASNTCFDDAGVWCFANVEGTFFPALSPGDPFGAPANFWTYTTTSVPEPSTLGLLAAGLFGLGFMRRKQAA